MGGITKSVSKIFKTAVDPLGLFIKDQPAPQQVAGPDPLPPPPVIVPPPPEMPIPLPDSTAVATAKRRSMAMQSRRRGRASTILTADQDTLGA